MCPGSLNHIISSVVQVQHPCAMNFFEGCGDRIVIILFYSIKFNYIY